MTIFEKITKAGSLLIINRKLFLKYLDYRVKRITPEWKNFKPPQFKKINGILFEIDLNQPGLNFYIKQIFFDYYEMSLVEVMKKTLKQGDVFLDVGAHIGYLSAVGASLVGKSGQVHSFEPVPEYFQFLKNLSKINQEYKIIVNNHALGEKSGITKIDCPGPLHGGGSTLVPGLLDINNIPKAKTINVQVLRLDSYIEENKLEKISLIKIDVEGFEFPVLKGLENYFKENNHRPIIICEIVPEAYLLLGYSQNQLLEYMGKYGYFAFNILNPRLRVDVTKFKSGAEVVFKTLK